jgi:hypothetical protein
MRGKIYTHANTHNDDSHWTRVSDYSGVVAGSVEKFPLAV